MEDLQGKATPRLCMDDFKNFAVGPLAEPLQLLKIREGYPHLSEDSP